MLTEEKKEYFRSILGQKLRSLYDDGREPLDDFIASGIAPPDAINQASIAMSSNFVLLLLERERRLVSKIKTALLKIEEGMYGICDNCGIEISEARLDNHPLARFCIICEKREEDPERLRGFF